MRPLKRICIIGIGNTLRSDDGLGIYICEELKRLNLEDVTIRTAHQLQTEWLFEFIEFKNILIVDASSGSNYEMRIEPLSDHASVTSGSSHHLNPNLLSGLMAVIHGSPAQLFTLAVPAEFFDFGENLSPSGLQHARKAVILIREWIATIPAQDD
jgi:hydrogenase maturation protease